MLGFNLEIQRLVSTFMTYRNDVDIYTEDEFKDKEFYSALIKKLVNPSIKINDVTPLGSKQAVIERCRVELPNGRKKLFIVDGDINLINGKNSYLLPNLYIHDAYCIENLLIDEQTVAKFIYIQCATKPESLIATELDYKNWLDQYTDRLIELFLNFAAVDNFGHNFTLNNAYRYHKLVGQNLIFDINAVDDEIKMIRSEILKIIPLAQYESEMTRLRTKWAKSEVTLTKICSGKDYLIPIVIIKTLEFKKSKSKPSLQEIKMLLLHFSDLKRFSPLKKAIESL
jgi:hypothetical protein